jgi:hypothetical protein
MPAGVVPLQVGPTTMENLCGLHIERRGRSIPRLCDPVSRYFNASDRLTRFLGMTWMAYRTTKLQDFRVATVVVVSCRKNDRDAWVLLAKDVDRRDPHMCPETRRCDGSGSGANPRMPVTSLMKAPVNICGTKRRTPFILCSIA